MVSMTAVCGALGRWMLGYDVFGSLADGRFSLDSIQRDVRQRRGLQQGNTLVFWQGGGSRKNYSMCMDTLLW